MMRIRYGNQSFDNLSRVKKKKKSDLAKVCHIGSELKAVSMSPISGIVAVGGRNAFKILKIEDDYIMRNMATFRDKQQGNYDTSVQSLSWNTKNTQNLASGATNGTVVLWNIDRRIAQYKFKGHSQSITSVEYTKNNMILSGAKDGLLNMWDDRMTSTTPAMTYTCQFGISSMQQHPIYENMVSAGFENGDIHIYDVRYSKNKISLNETKKGVHDQWVGAVEWHPTKKWLASGGRDRMIKVWNLDQRNTKDQRNSIEPQCIIYTIGAIRCLRWRKDHRFPYHLASGCASPDHSVNLYDIRNPMKYLPLVSYTSHTAGVNDFRWFEGPNDIISVSEDGTCKIQLFDEGIQYRKTMKTQTVDISTNNDVLFLQSPQQRVILEKAPVFTNDQGDAPFNPYAIDQLTFTPSEPHDCKPSAIHLQVEHLVDESEVDSFYYFCNNLASHTLQDGDEFVKLCEHNGQVCEEIHKIDLRDTWLMIGHIFENVPFKQNNAQHVVDDPKVEEEAPPQQNSFMMNEGDVMEVLDSDDSDDDSDDNEMTDSSNDSDDSSTDEDNDIDGFSNEVNEKLMGEESNQILHQEGIFTHNPEELENVYSTSDDEEPASTTSPDSFVSNQIQLDKGPPALTMLSGDDVPSNGTCNHPIFNLLPMYAIIPHEALARNLFDYYSSIGDVQMCAILWRVLRHRINQAISKERGEEFEIAYVDLMNSRRLFVQATEFCNSSEYPSLSEKSLNESLIMESCCKCHSTSVNSESMCSKCKKQTQCVICHLPTSGLYLSCQNCGNGGCLDHIYKFLKKFGKCPICRCSYKVFQWRRDVQNRASKYLFQNIC